MLLAILFLIFLSTETGITVLVKSIMILLLGQPNLDSFFSISNDITNSSVSVNNESFSLSSCDYSIASGTYNYESATNFDNYLKVQRWQSWYWLPPDPRPLVWAGSWDKQRPWPSLWSQSQWIARRRRSVRRPWRRWPWRTWRSWGTRRIPATAPGQCTLMLDWEKALSASIWNRRLEFFLSDLLLNN